MRQKRLFAALLIGTLVFNMNSFCLMADETDQSDNNGPHNYTEDETETTETGENNGQTEENSQEDSENRSEDTVNTESTPTPAPTYLPYTPDPNAVVTPYAAPTRAPGDYDDTERFIIRLYSYCLGRDFDSQGLSEWHAALVNGTSNGADCGYGFVFSNEYLGRNTSNEEYVGMLYRVFLDREPDNAGIEAWVKNLESGMSREHIFSGFVMSPEYSQICANYGISHGNYYSSQARDENIAVTSFVQRLYNVALGRPGEADGLNFWCRRLNDDEIYFEDCAQAFVNSQEFIRKGLSNEEYIRVLYRVFLDREADQQGLDAWVAQLEAGVARTDMLRNFAYSSEFTSLINNVVFDSREIITHTSGTRSWVQVMTDNGLLTDSTAFQRDLIERANSMLAAETAYGFGRTVPENGTIDCSAFVTNLFRRTLGTMDVIDHYAGGGVCESDNAGPYYHYFGGGLQDLTDRGSWTTNTYTEGRYTCPGCGYVYVDRYGITSTDLMDCCAWDRYLRHFNVSSTTVSFTENRRMRPIVYGIDGEIVSWGEWEFMQDFRPGDIVLWTDAEHNFSTGSGNNHIGIYMGNGMVCHATSADYDQPDLPTTNRGMQLTSISAIRSYYQKEGKGSIVIYHIF
ncbi:MAG: DUF4214 domain-containing protein [Clostridiales bacterium]|nr:DUF4214 domain-containing protein [Clostridiales bacterium]